jgi:hypothetical protein
LPKAEATHLLSPFGDEGEEGAFGLAERAVAGRDEKDKVRAGHDPLRQRLKGGRGFRGTSRKAWAAAVEIYDSDGGGGGRWWRRWRW